MSVAERDGCSGARLALARHLRNGDKAAVARCWDCCHFSAPQGGGPERAVPNILNKEKVFTVFQGDLVSRSTFFPRIRCVLSALDGLAGLLVRAAGITELLAKS
jgi:hypothetical protein